MLIRNDHIYRTEAIEFQGRRLAGEVSLTPTRKLVAGTGLFIAIVSCGLVAISQWTIPVDLAANCTIPSPSIIETPSSAFRGGAGDTVVALSVVISGSAPLERTVDSQSAGAYGATRFVLSEPLARSAVGSGGCSLVARLQVHPVTAALQHAWRRP